jgi:processive rubber oxygenase RoxA-like protein
MKALFKVFLFSLGTMVSTYDPTFAQPVAGASVNPTLQYANQGWTPEGRQAFYTTSQGSHLIPYLWYKALRRPDADEPFGADQLQRYGYLPNDKSELNPEGLPIGFVIDGDAKTGYLGMTCAACHTAQIEYQRDGVTQKLRIDGAPTMANFQLFLTDLATAAKATMADTNRLDQFARSVLGASSSPAKVPALKTDFGTWVEQFGNFMDASLPASSWGPGRFDAFGMIFNRVAAYDLDIDANFKVADAPVSYPFLWNASRQDKTQWNGNVPNGLFINALGRNAGKVFGLFAEFGPKKLTDTHPPLIDYSKNSIKFAGLQALEEKIAALKPPLWPFELKYDLVDRGRLLFAARCGSCHEEKRSPQGTWFTPVLAVGTDSKMFTNADRGSEPGSLAGAPTINPPGSTLTHPTKTRNILATAVVGSLINEAFPPPPRLPNPNGGVWQAIRKDLSDLLPDSQSAPTPLLLLEPSVRANMKSHVESRLANIFRPPSQVPAYESRVLHGIWATAPYLHNGSVPNLWELLLPANRRSTSFMVGSRVYDPVYVGYVTDRSPFKDGKLVVGAGAEAGNSNAGHEFGVDLSEDDRWALIEYLKQL